METTKHTHTYFHLLKLHQFTQSHCVEELGLVLVLQKHYPQPETAEMSTAHLTMD